MKTKATSRHTPPKRRGRPVSYVMPERIDAPPELIAATVLNATPKRQWRYLQETKRTRR